MGSRWDALAALAVVIVLVAVGAGCKSAAEEREEHRAGAVFESLGYQHVSGLADFEETPSGLHIAIDVQNLEPGDHAVFVCEGTDCASEGAHFNPTRAAHGSRKAAHHAGDLGNLRASDGGIGHLELVCDDLYLHAGENSILGRVIVVADRADDFATQPSGDAGRAIACGLIVRRR